MKRRIFLLIHIVLLTVSLSAQDSGWEWDAGKADGFYYAGDYDAAWLFYERAMLAGADDAKVLFRAAESFRRQQITENPEFLSALYTTAASLMVQQYPDDSLVAKALASADPNVVVNRRYIRKTYGMIGAKAPRTGGNFTDGFFGRIRQYGTARVEDLGTFSSILFTEGPGDVIAWARGNLWNLFLAYVLMALIPGIILPAVMAVTVAREGRKSYVTAYLFLIFWGPLGIHRFYIGRYISGIIWLLTGGLFGFGVFFDIFLTGAYIRFWNEDHRDNRPSNRIASDGFGVSRRVTEPSAPKKKRGPKVSKAPKPPKTPKPPKASTAAKPIQRTMSKPASRSTADSTGGPGFTGSTGASSAAAGLAAGAFSSASAAAGVAEDNASVRKDDKDPTDFAMDDLEVLSGSADGDVLSFDDDFGDLPNLDLDGDDFDIPDAGDGGVDEKELDLESFE